MVAVGFLLVWGGYSVGLWGWCLLRDYDLTMAQLVSPNHPYSGPWPPAKIPATQIWPGGTTPAPKQQAAAKPGGSPGIVGDILNLPGIKDLRTITGL